MKSIIHLVSIMLISTMCHISRAQEFPLQDRGLVYDKATMGKLHTIVDSLNLKFIQCESAPTYYAPAQAKVHSLFFKKDEKKALKQIKEGASFEDLIENFPKAKVTRDKYLVKTYGFKGGNQVSNYTVIAANGAYIHNFEKDTDAFAKELQEGNWIYNKTDYGLVAIYLAEDMLIQKLPQRYALMVGYADCMVDTTTTIFSDIAIKSKYDWDENSAALKFIRNNRLPGDGPNESEFENIEDYFEAASNHNKKAIDYIETKLKTDDLLRQSLIKTVKKSVKTGGSTELFEHLTEKFVSKEMALDLKRSRIVVGICSMDSGPRDHALEIARLSAETTNWSIFLRSHLDLMNDNFSRNTDGSYAWADRSTYVKELEDLDIDVRDLLLGITLRVNSPAQHRYSGNNRRTARAIAESNNPAQYFTDIISAIEDEELDLYNRMCMSFLALNYLDNQKEGQEKERKATRSAINTLPDFIKISLITYLD